MRILMVHVPYLIRGGEDESAEAEYKTLKAAGHEVEFWKVPNVADDQLTAAIRCSWSRNVYKRTRWKIKDTQPDVLYAQNLHHALGPSVFVAANSLNIPNVWSIRNHRLACPQGMLFRDGQPCHECVGRMIAWPGIKYGCYRGSRPATAALAVGTTLNLWWWDTYFDCVDVFAAVSDYVRGVMVKHGLPEDRIIVKPAVVHPDPLRGSDPWAEQPDRGYFVFAARLVPGKGLATVLEAWRRLGEHAPELRIIGDGPDARLLTNLPLRISWHGKLSHVETMEQIREARAVLAPSLCDEPLGRLPIEAAACGTPAIVANSGGLPESVWCDQWIHEPGDAISLAAIVADMARMSTSEVREVRRLQRQYWRAYHSAAVQERALIGLFNEAILARRARGLAPQPVELRL